MSGCFLSTIAQHSVPSKHMEQGLCSSLCKCVLYFLISRLQTVDCQQLLPHTGTPQACILSSLLYLCTMDCVVRYSSNILKLTDNATFIRQQWVTTSQSIGKRLRIWLSDNGLVLNVSKTEGLIVDFKKRKLREHVPTFIAGQQWRHNSFKFLG